MARKIKIEKVSRTTIVSTYDSSSPSLKKIVLFNGDTKVSFDTRNDLVTIETGDMACSILFNLSQLEGDFSSTNLEDLAQEFATKGLFTGEI